MKRSSLRRLIPYCGKLAITTLEQVWVPASHTLYLYRAWPVSPVDVDVGRGRPAPSETHRIYSSHLFLLGPELERSRRRSWRRRRRGRTGLCAVSPAGVHLHAVFIKSPPNDHFTAGPHCRVIGSGIGRVGPAGGHPTVSAWIVSPAGIQPAAAAPDDHFAASPDCCVTKGAVRRIGSSGCHPAVGARIISAAGVMVQGAICSTPHDHFTASPHCRVIDSGVGRVGRAGGRPTVRAGIVSPAGVHELEVFISSAPDDHFTASPHCRVKASASGRVRRAGGGPAIIDASARLIRYCR